MGRARQSPVDREKRLNEGRCPTHGLWMGQIDVWYVNEHGTAFTIVGCPRGDCTIKAKAYSFDGPWELFEASERETWDTQLEYEAAQHYLTKHGLVAHPAE